MDGAPDRDERETVELLDAIQRHATRNTRRPSAFWNEEMKYVVEPGEFTVMTGPDSVDLKSATLTVAE